jgi:hypothetical protein
MLYTILCDDYCTISANIAYTCQENCSEWSPHLIHETECKCEQQTWIDALREWVQAAKDNEQWLQTCFTKGGKNYFFKDVTRTLGS